MNSKIVILDDSVILYQHFISDDNWETVMAFPRGGLTYLIKNDNIKFFAFEDYLYRNCLMTMDLPLYLIDESLGIDGEYDDIQEITEILNRIFPINSDRDLSLYLKKREAEELYQPVGDYQPVGNYFDDVEYDSSGKTIDFYSQGTLVDSIDARPFIKDGMVDSVTLIELSGDTYLHIVFNTDAGKEPLDIPLGDIFDADNYYTKQEVDGLLDDKLDASAYTPTDLSNYYNKQEVDALIPEVPSLDGYATETWVKNQGYINQLKTINNISLIGEGNIQIGSGGTIDAYTKEEADARFQPKGNYVTEATVIQYITNLQEQITNIIQTVSGCCSETGETTYRWITMTGENDYVCSGSTKYTKEKKQQSTDGGITWTDVYPAQYQRGSTILEVDSEDCGYIEPQYRWKAAPTSDYMCSGTSKYYKVYYEVSYDNGVTWQHVVPEQTKRGNLIEANSPDCGYSPETQYRWYQAPASDYICSGTSKYYKEYYQVSTDGGQTWTNVTPIQTRVGALIESQSSDCNITSTMTYKVSASTTTTSDTKVVASSLELRKLEVQLTAGTYTLINISNQGGAWGRFTYNSDNALGKMSHSTNQLSHGCMFGIPLTSINVGEGITKLDDQCLYGNELKPENNVLRSIVLPSTLEILSYDAIDKQPLLETITINAVTPPAIQWVTVGYILFRSCPNLTSVYVPASSVNAYKTAEGWSTIASLIKPKP